MACLPLRTGWFLRLLDAGNDALFATEAEHRVEAEAALRGEWVAAVTVAQTPGVRCV
jgi:hypothetical protein